MSNYPGHIERQYERLFSGVIKTLAREVKKRLIAELNRDIETDADYRSIQTQVEETLDEILASESFRKKIEKIFVLVDAWSFSRLKNAVRKMAYSRKGELLESIIFDKDSPLIQETIKKFIETNRQLVRTLGKTYIKDVSDNAIDTFLNGGSRKDLARTFLEHTEGNVNKARFWARDQMSSAFGELNKQRQTAAGIPGYIWRTVGDNRVRGSDPDDETSHIALNGRFFTWSRGAANTGQISKPGALHPGEDYNCRCFPDPAFGPE